MTREEWSKVFQAAKQKTQYAGDDEHKDMYPAIVSNLDTYALKWVVEETPKFEWSIEFRDAAVVELVERELLGD